VNSLVVELNSSFLGIRVPMGKFISQIGNEGSKTGNGMKDPRLGMG